MQQQCHLSPVLVPCFCLPSASLQFLMASFSSSCYTSSFWIVVGPCMNWIVRSVSLIQPITLEGFESSSFLLDDPAGPPYVLMQSQNAHRRKSQGRWPHFPRKSAVQTFGLHASDSVCIGGIHPFCLHLPVC